MYRGTENNFLNKISTCFLTMDVQVQYGGDRYTAYEETIYWPRKFGLATTKKSDNIKLY